MNIAIIAAAGSGTRMGGGEGKQLRTLKGAPLVVHSLRRFEACRSVGSVIAVVPSGDVGRFVGMAHEFRLTKLARVVAGGKTRGESVWRGLQAIRAETAEIVAVHDAARPFVSSWEIDETIQAAQQSGASVLVAPAVDTIKEIKDGHIVRTLPRTLLRHALTPQCFRYELLREAYERAICEGGEFTDDSQLVEATGVSVRVVEGSRRNIKITTPEDWALAEVLASEFED